MHWLLIAKRMPDTSTVAMRMGLQQMTRRGTVTYFVEAKAMDL